MLIHWFYVTRGHLASFSGCSKVVVVTSSLADVHLSAESEVSLARYPEVPPCSQLHYKKPLALKSHRNRKSKKQSGEKYNIATEERNSYG